MTRCQEAAFASVLLTVPRPWLGSFVCSAHVCKVCAIIGSCMYRDTQVPGYVPYEPLPGCPEPSGTPWALAGFSVPEGTKCCCLREQQPGKVASLLGWGCQKRCCWKSICVFTPGHFWIWHVPFLFQFNCKSYCVFFLKRNQFKHIIKWNICSQSFCNCRVLFSLENAKKILMKVVVILLNSNPASGQKISKFHCWFGEMGLVFLAESRKEPALSVSGF